MHQTEMARYPKCRDCGNANCLVKLCLPTWEKLIDANKLHVPVKKRSKVFDQGAPLVGAYFLYKGKIKIYNSGPENREQIIRFAADGDLLISYGEGDPPVLDVSAAALEDSEVCLIERAVFDALVEGNPKLTMHLLAFYSSELIRMDRQLRKMAQFSIRQKVADALLRIADKFGFERDGYSLAVNISRKDIASLSGSVPEVISRVLADMARENVLKLDGRYIRIADRENLRRLAM